MKITLCAFFLVLFFGAHHATASTINIPSNYLFMNSGLVGYWTFDGKDINWATNKATDKSGLGNTGTLINMSTTTSPAVGKIGQALNFNGSNSYVSVANSSSLNPNNLTVSVWVKSNTNTWNDYGFLVSKRNVYIIHPNQNATTVNFYIYTTGWTSITCTPTNSITVWNLYSFIWDGTNLTAYINGAQCSTNVPGGAINTSDTNELDIGRDAGLSRYFNGLIDDVRIYNRALSASEIRQLYNLGAAKFAVGSDQALTSGLVGYWTFDGKDINWATNKVTDKSGLGNTGQLINMSTTTSPVVGKIGQGLNFDGVNDSVYNSSPSWNFNGNPTATFSIAAWFKPTTCEDLGGISLASNLVNLRLMSRSAGAWAFQLVAGYTLIQSANGTCKTNQWQHVVGVYDSSITQYYLYINGSSAASPVTPTVTDTSAGSSYLSIGYAQYYFNGAIDDVRVYNRALSASEVRQLYNLGAAKLISTGSVVGRYVFYNNSAWDGNDAAANVSDDSAIASDKQALLPGGTATFSNYTSYLQGINGVMVDISGSHPNISASDFTFKVGNDNSPAGWSLAATPAVTIRAGAGTGSSSRVTIIWPDATVQKQWLQVTVKATVNTGLSANDVFYFGNAIGEVGNDPTSAVVNGVDEALIRGNQRNFLNPAPIDFWYDIDRNKRVDVGDEMMSRNNSTTSSNALQLITVP